MYYIYIFHKQSCMCWVNCLQWLLFPHCTVVVWYPPACLQWCVHLSGITGRQPLTPCGRDKMAAILQTTFSDAFLWNKNVYTWIKISLKFVPKGPINNIPTLVQIMAWRRPGDKPLSEPMMVSLPTHICVTQPQWVKDGLTTGLHFFFHFVDKKTAQIETACGQIGCTTSVVLDNSTNHNCADRSISSLSRLLCQKAWKTCGVFFLHFVPSFVPIGGCVEKYNDGIPDSKFYGVNMGPIWGRQDPGGPLVGPMNFVIWDR